MRVLLLLSFLACATAEPMATPLPESPVPLGPPQRHTIAVVRVPAPWWAPGFLITRRFIDSIPEYASAPGLLHKAYTLSDHREFGGVYLWSSRAEAEAWFTPAWHERVRRLRGVDGDVRLLDARHTVETQAPLQGRPLAHHGLETSACVTWLASEPGATLTLEGLSQVLPLATGLVRSSFVTESDGRLGAVLLFSSRDAARAYWSTARLESVRGVMGPHTLTWFDAPVLLDAAAEQAVSSDAALTGVSR